MTKSNDRQHIRDLIRSSLNDSALHDNAVPVPSETAPIVDEDATSSPAAEGQGYFDFDLAEFPLFRLYRHRGAADAREPLVYRDTILGRDRQPVTREWKVFPGPLGFGGETTQSLLYDLLQLYIEQGCQGSQIQFGTLRSLFLRRGARNPSRGDYERIRRDLDILRGYDIHCKNAFWDHKRQAYVDMKWRLFGDTFFFKNEPTDDGGDVRFGFIEVSSTFRQIARARGFFGLGFEHRFFHGLKPLQQRLAIYLAKKFVSQKLHRRFIEDLCRALPIEAERPDNQRALLRRAAEGLSEAGFTLLANFKMEKGKDGRWLAVFHRRQSPASGYRIARASAGELIPGVSALVDRIVEMTRDPSDRLWWMQCVRRLGPGPVDRALGQLKEAIQSGKVRSRGALLTKIFKDIAEEAGIVLH
jgi:hypothetical protein